MKDPFHNSSFNLHAFLSSFDLLAEAPGGVPKLRELILQLAVRGQLVPQEEGRGKGGVHHEGHEEHEGRNVAEVPTTWRVVPLERLADVVRGVSYKKHDATEAAAPGLVPILRGHNIQNEINLNDLVFVPETYVKPEQYIRKGDILVAMSSGSKSLVGKAAQSTLDMTAAFGAFCGVVRFEDRSLTDWARVFFRTPQYRRAVSSAGQGIGINNLGKGDILGLPFPLPPLAEQKRIVARVDELMKRCDELEARQKECDERHTALVSSCLHAVADTKQPNPNFIIHPSSFNLLFSSPSSVAELRKTILQLAVQGRLVSQDPKVEPVETLLDVIQAERAKRVRDGALRERSDSIPPVLPQASSPLPSGWVISSFGTLVFNRDGERVPVSQADREKRRGEFDYYGASGVIDKIDDYLFDQPLLLIGEDGANLVNRSTPIAFIATGKYWVNNHAHVLEAVNDDFLRYLTLFINATDLRPYITGTAQPKMNQAKMNAIPVAVPPLAEQKRIVAKVNELMALCDALEAKLTQSRTDADTLAAAIVHAIEAGSQNGK